MSVQTAITIICFIIETYLDVIPLGMLVLQPFDVYLVHLLPDQFIDIVEHRGEDIVNRSPLTNIRIDVTADQLDDEPSHCDAAIFQSLCWIILQICQREMDILIFVISGSETRLDGLVKMLHCQPECVSLFEI